MKTSSIEDRLPGTDSSGHVTPAVDCDGRPSLTSSGERHDAPVKIVGLPYFTGDLEGLVARLGVASAVIDIIAFVDSASLNMGVRPAIVGVEERDPVAARMREPGFARGARTRVRLGRVAHPWIGEGRDRRASHRRIRRRRPRSLRPTSHAGRLKDNVKALADVGRWAARIDPTSARVGVVRTHLHWEVRHLLVMSIRAGDVRALFRYAAVALREEGIARGGRAILSALAGAFAGPGPARA